MGKVVKTLFGGSSQKQQSTQQSNSQLDPRMFEMFDQNRQRATGVADNLQARQIAGFTPDFYAGRDQVLSTVGGAGQRSLEAAQAGARQGMDFNASNVNAQRVTGQGYDAATGTSRGYDPTMGTSRGYDATMGSAAMGNRGDVRNVSGGSFLNANIGEYMNPYLNLVAGNTINDMDRSRQMMQRQNADAASSARAFGGSRQGVLEAETNRGYFDRLGNTLGGLYASGFDSASALATRDLDRALQADTSNQGVDLNVLGLNTGNQQQMNLANMAASNDASRFGADAANNMSLANMAASNDAGRFGADAANNMSLANMAALNQAGMFGAAATNQANLANQASDLTGQLANQGAGLDAARQRLAAANQLAGFGETDQRMALQRAEALGSLGMAQQSLTQAQMDAIRNLPLEQQLLINQSLGLNVGGGSGAISSSTGQSSGTGSSQKGIIPGLTGGFSALFPGGI